MVDAATQQDALTPGQFEVELNSLRTIVATMNATWREDHVRTGPLRVTDGNLRLRETDEERAARQAREAEAAQARLARQHQLENDAVQAGAICNRLSGTKVKLTVKATAHRSRFVGTPGLIGGHDEAYDVPVAIMFTEVELSFSLGRHSLQLMGSGPSRVVASCLYDDERVTFDPYGEDTIMQVLPS
jgi:hypothetical protein